MDIQLIVKASLLIALVCFAIIIIDILAGHYQQMGVMNFVYPITALYAGPLALAVYYTLGRMSTQKALAHAERKGETPPNKQKPFWQSVVVVLCIAEVVVQSLI